MFCVDSWENQVLKGKRSIGRPTRLIKRGKLIELGKIDKILAMSKAKGRTRNIDFRPFVHVKEILPWMTV